MFKCLIQCYHICVTEGRKDKKFHNLPSKNVVTGHTLNPRSDTANYRLGFFSLVITRNITVNIMTFMYYHYVRKLFEIKDITIYYL